VTAMKLETMTANDLDLRIREETDPRMMSELGGPRPVADIERAHARSLDLAAEGECWPLKVIPDGSSAAAGGVAIFPSSHDGQEIYEIGWMILPEFQNRGLASEAVREVLEQSSERAQVWTCPRVSRHHQWILQQDLRKERFHEPRSVRDRILRTHHALQSLADRPVLIRSPRAVVTATGIRRRVTWGKPRD